MSPAEIPRGWSRGGASGRRSAREARAEALFRELLAAGGERRRVRELLERWDPDDTLLVEVLRRPLPAPALELLGTLPPWTDRPRVLGAVARNVRTPRSVALRVLPALYWPDLAAVATNMYLASALRVRAEGLLIELLPDLRIGDRISLARQASGGVLRQMLADADPRVTRVLLLNPRLRESDLVDALSQERPAEPLFRELSLSTRWMASYAVRLALVLQPRTPLGIVLAQLTSLTHRDLQRVARTRGLLPLVQAAAARAAGGAEPRRA